MATPDQIIADARSGQLHPDAAQSQLEYYYISAFNMDQFAARSRAQAELANAIQQGGVAPADTYGANYATPPPAPLPPPEANIAELLNDPELFQAIYNQAKGIPSAGRSMYERWLASRWQTSATDYALSQVPGIGDVGLTAAPTGPAGQTYAQYLGGRVGQPVGQVSSGYLGALTAMDPTQQRAKLELLPSYVRQNIIRGGFRGLGAPGFIAQGLTSQAMARAPQFEISPEGLRGDSFLNYLKTKYGI